MIYKKRTPPETLERLKAVRKNYRHYHFELVGVQPPRMTLDLLGVEGLQDYYDDQVKDRKNLKPLPGNLQNYCCLFTHKLEKFCEGNPGYISQKDIDYASKTIIALDARIGVKIDHLTSLVNSETCTNECQETFNEIRALIRAMETLASNEFVKLTRSCTNKKLVNDVRTIISQYRELGFISGRKL